MLISYYSQVNQLMIVGNRELRINKSKHPIELHILFKRKSSNITTNTQIKV